MHRQGDKGAGCRELSKPLLDLPKCRCTGLGNQSQGVSVSQTCPVAETKGWVTGLWFLCWTCPGAEALGWGPNLRVSVSPLPGLPSCRSNGMGHRPQVRRSLAAVSIQNELGNSNKAVLTELPRGQVWFPKGDSVDTLDAIDSMESTRLSTDSLKNA